LFLKEIAEEANQFSGKQESTTMSALLNAQAATGTAFVIDNTGGSGSKNARSTDTIREIARQRLAQRAAKLAESNNKKS